VVETMRLNRTLTCPGCLTPVKPFVVGPVSKDSFGRKMVEVRCPAEECGTHWQAIKETEEG